MTVALAAALSSMAARFATDHLTEASVMAERAEKFRGEVAPLAQTDTAAYGCVLEAYRLPPEHHQRRIREALFEAADVPPSIAEIAARLVEGGNPNLRGDAVAAVELNVSAGGTDDGRLARARELVAGAAVTQQAAAARGM